MVDACKKENMAVYMPDMYGHGYSEGTRFLIPVTWKNNLQDLLHFVDLVAKEQGDSVPLFVMGESYGGTLTLHAAKYYQDNPEAAPKSFKGILLTGPAIVGDLPPAPVVFVLRYLLAPYFPAWTPFFMPNPVSPERIWRDPQVLAKRTEKRYKEMGIDGSGLPFKLGSAANMLTALEEVRTKAIPGFKVPFCVIHGTKDAGVPIAGSDLLWYVVSPGD
jgi:alpha-beta hydrolase superfamily lysophospholipase